MSAEIPTLHTERLILRAFTAADLDAYARMLANPNVMRFLGTGQTRSIADAWNGIAGGLGQWALRGYGSFAIEDRATGDLVGRAGILHPYDWPGPELAYALDEPFWGHGLATEACREVLRWARTEAGLGELVSFIYPDNHASKGVVQHLGAVRGPDVTLMGIEGLECWHHRVPVREP
jgi:RimJ/RimL family protein N-acetyltransferase